LNNCYPVPLSLTFFFLQYWGLNSGPSPWATPPTLFFCEGFFKIVSHRTLCPGWLRTANFLISASWVAKITGVSHWCLSCQWPLRCTAPFLVLAIFLCHLVLITIPACSMWATSKHSVSPLSQPLATSVLFVFFHPLVDSLTAQISQFLSTWGAQILKPAFRPIDLGTSFNWATPLLACPPAHGAFAPGKENATLLCFFHVKLAFLDIHPPSSHH
jgi:hypothetical protein